MPSIPAGVHSMTKVCLGILEEGVQALADGTGTSVLHRWRLPKLGCLPELLYTASQQFDGSR